MIRPTSLILLALSAAAGGTLFHVSFEVSGLEERLARLNRQISADREAIHVLRAEWSFLNQPGRIEELSRRYLDLAPLTGGQLATADAVPVRLGDTEDDAPAPPRAVPPGDSSGPAIAVPEPAPAIVQVAAQPATLPRTKPAPPRAPTGAAAPAAAPRAGEDDRTLEDVLREITAEVQP